MIRWSDAIWTVAMAAVALLGVWWYALVDTLAVPLWVAAVFAALWSPFLVLFRFRMPRRLWNRLYAAFLLALLGTWIAPWHAAKNFCRDVSRIRKGMTVAQVRDRLGPWVAGVPPTMEYGPGWYGRQGGRYVVDPWSVTDGEIAILGTVAYRNHPEAAADTADFARIVVADGHVVETEFVYD